MEEGDPFSWIIQFCRPTTSQEAILPNCPMAGTNECYSDSDSSPAQSPSRGPIPPGIIDISSAEASGSIPKNVDDGVRVRVNECGEMGENETEAIGPSKRRRLPASLTSKGKEKENDVPNVGKNGELMEFLDVLKAVFEKGDDESDEDEDFFGMIQRKGFKFDKPRWWP